MVKVVKFESISGSHIAVPDSELVIGRGFLECDDKRVSRQHGVIRTEIAAGECLVYIKSLHPTNPIFYRRKEDTANDSILKKNENLLLDAGDKFRLTPDGDWFVVEEAERTPRESTPKTEDLGNMADGADLNLHDTSAANEAGAKRKLECANSTEAEGTKRSRVGGDDDTPSTASETTEPSSSARIESQPAISIKPDPDSQIPSSTSVASPVPVNPNPEQDGSATTSTTTVNVKPDPDGGAGAVVGPDVVVKSPADTAGTLRPSCDFGIKCYRGGNDHRNAFAHPGDLDYRRPDFPPAPLDAPLCPFGARCYRRNPVHFQEYQHPDPRPRTLDRPSRPFAPFVPDAYHDYSDDEEHEDPDFDGTSSDEYFPGRYHDDDDESESEDEGLGGIDSELLD